MSGFVRALTDGPVLISDGGLASELSARGHDLADALWSARLLLDAPDEVAAAHRTFFDAGAVIATTASYQASFDGFAARGIDRAETARLLRASVEIAWAARVVGDGRSRWVAASVGPYGACLPDAAEYRGRYGLSVAELRAWHEPRLAELIDASPDVLALETLPDVDEAEALVDLLDGVDVPAWLSFTIEGNRTRAGQPLRDAFAVAAEVPEVVAVGVNCCAPDDVAGAIAAAREVTGKPVVVQPNSGEGWDVRRRQWTGSSRFTPEHVREWLELGARVIGGCCRVRPVDIAMVARMVG